MYSENYSRCFQYLDPFSGSDYVEVSWPGITFEKLVYSNSDIDLWRVALFAEPAGLPGQLASYDRPLYISVSFQALGRKPLVQDSLVRQPRVGVCLAANQQEQAPFSELLKQQPAQDLDLAQLEACWAKLALLGRR